jgi:hypothetical protein
LPGLGRVGQTCRAARIIAAGICEVMIAGVLGEIAKNRPDRTRVGQVRRTGLVDGIGAVVRSGGAGASKNWPDRARGIHTRFRVIASAGTAWPGTTSARKLPGLGRVGQTRRSRSGHHDPIGPDWVTEIDANHTGSVNRPRRDRVLLIFE